MIWATVSSQFCFCWLYRAFPSLATKNIINLISVLTIWWCPCVESSLVFLEEGVCYDQCILLAKLLAFACFILYSKAKLACYCRYLLILRIWLIFSVLSIFPFFLTWYTEHVLVLELDTCLKNWKIQLLLFQHISLLTLIVSVSQKGFSSLSSCNWPS